MISNVTTARFTIALTLLVAAASLGGCESARKVFSGQKSAPDEFAVYSRPPLSLPPDYQLRPPAPGVRAPDLDAARIAKQAVTGRAQPAPAARQAVAASRGLQALLRDTGALNASADIRTIVDEETSRISTQDQAFVDKLIFWVEEKPFPGTVVDAEKEQKRIQENQALGKPITEGETPDIKRRRGRKGLLDF